MPRYACAFSYENKVGATALSAWGGFFFLEDTNDTSPDISAAYRIELSQRGVYSNHGVLAFWPQVRDRWLVIQYIMCYIYTVPIEFQLK